MGDGLDQSLVDILEKQAIRRDESLMIAARLAARLGLERVYPIDDHSADSVVDDDTAYGKALSAAWDNPATATRTATNRAIDARLAEPGGVLAAYRAYNAPTLGALAYRSDFGAALEESSSQRYGRQYVGYWETRNLRMAANIRDILGRYPGTRMLVVVGASHKAYLEAYLDAMHDVRLIDASTLLR